MGLILVFDMDQTILDSSDPSLDDDTISREQISNTIVESLNKNVVRLLIRASALRLTGEVSAIFLLTNNSSIPFISLVDDILRDITGSTGIYKKIPDPDDIGMPEKSYFFDYIMIRQHPRRPQVYDPPKTLYDILIMMENIGIYDETKNKDILKDIYFFDDIGTHQIKRELAILEDGIYKDHYIQITPPYSKNKEDLTDYSPILKVIPDTVTPFPKKRPTRYNLNSLNINRTPTLIGGRSSTRRNTKKNKKKPRKRI
jgi:hypothetical protein